MWEQQEAIRRFAAAGRVGPLLYDALIGEVARMHHIGTILTWNTRHMAGLFPIFASSHPRSIFAGHDP